MVQAEKLLAQISRAPSNVRYSDLVKVCDHFFGPSRQSGSSHKVYKMPWQGDPRVNIQNFRGKAKPYQVKQVLAAISKLEGEKR